MGAFFACCRSFVPDDGPVYGVVMHPGEYFGNVTTRVTKLFKVRGKAETERFRDNQRERGFIVRPKNAAKESLAPRLCLKAGSPLTKRESQCLAWNL